MNLNRTAKLFSICLIIGLLVACKSDDDNEPGVASVRLHLESRDDGLDRTMEVPIIRSNPVMIRVGKVVYLHEGYLEQARLVYNPGGYVVSLKFNTQGGWLLESLTGMNVGKRIAVMGQFDDQTRWLAAPQVDYRVTNAVFNFTPDMDETEAKRFVKGLNLMVEKNKDPVFKN